jgi:hypothetical protein
MDEKKAMSVNDALALFQSVGTETFTGAFDSPFEVVKLHEIGEKVYTFDTCGGKMTYFIHEYRFDIETNHASLNGMEMREKHYAMNERARIMHKIETWFDENTPFICCGMLLANGFRMSLERG